MCATILNSFKNIFVNNLSQSSKIEWKVIDKILESGDVVYIFNTHAATSLPIPNGRHF